MKSDNMLRKKEAVGIDSLVKEYIKDMKIAAGLNRQLASNAWLTASGAGRYTLSTDFRGWKLHVRVSSSAVRSQLYLQKEVIMNKINDLLAKENLFSPPADGSVPVKDIIIM